MAGSVNNYREGMCVRSGLTLLEMLLAVVLVGTAGVAVLEALQASRVAIRNSLNHATAMRLAQERLEQVSAMLGLSEGTGSNPEDDFLPALDKVCVRKFGDVWLTESDYYQKNYGTAGSLTALTPPQRVDRITVLKWVDDPDGGTAQDYLLAEVYCIWGAKKSVKVSRYVLVK